MAGFGFGSASGVITTLGMIVGLYSASSDRLAIIGGIVTVSVADALSDALGEHISEESKRHPVARDVRNITISTFVTKLLIGLSFLIPFIFLNYSLHIYLGPSSADSAEVLLCPAEHDALVGRLQPLKPSQSSIDRNDTQPYARHQQGCVGQEWAVRCRAEGMQPHDDQHRHHAGDITQHEHQDQRATGGRHDARGVLRARIRNAEETASISQNTNRVIISPA